MAISGLTTPTAAATTTAMPWKSYDQYWKDKGQGDEAAKWSGYRSSYMPGTTDALNWGATGNPYRFSEEYNQYKSTLPQQYQDLISYGISPESVAGGQVTSIVRPTGTEAIQLPGGGTAGSGAGSSFSLASDVLSKMWK